jgi:predicted transcriptional regulator
LREGGWTVALLKAPTKQKTITLQVRLEEDVRVTLNRYAQFINANPSYVVSEALKLLFKKDPEFKRWLSQHTKTGGQEQNEGADLAKAASQT